MGKGVTRRAVLAAAGAAGALGTVTEVGSGSEAVKRQTVADGWPAFSHDAANTGHAPGETGPKPGVEEQWRFETGLSVVSSPAVVDGAVYVGSGDGRVYALSADDGSEEWRFQTGDNVDSSPAVVDGTVYVGSNDGNVYALSASDGSEEWRTQLDSEVSLPLTVVDGSVYASCYEGPLYRIDAADGTKQWRSGGGALTSPAVADGTVYVGRLNGRLHAVAASDGTEQWEFQGDPIMPSSPAVAGDTVYTGDGDGALYAVSTSGNEVWSFETGNSIAASPAVAGDTVYVANRGGTVYALSTSDGSRQWRFQSNNDITCSPALVDGIVYVGSWDNRVYALDATDGTELWRFETGNMVQGSLAVVDGTVYVGSRDRNVYALTSGPAQTATATPTATESSATAGTNTTASTTTETSDGGSTPIATDSPTASTTSIPAETVVSGGGEPGTTTTAGDTGGLEQWLGLGGGALATVLLAGGITRLYGGSSTSPPDGGDPDDSTSTRPDEDRPDDGAGADDSAGNNGGSGEGPLVGPASKHEDRVVGQGDPPTDAAAEDITERAAALDEAGDVLDEDVSPSKEGTSRVESQGGMSTDGESSPDEESRLAVPETSDELSDDSGEPARHAELRGRLTGLRTAVEDATERIEETPSVARDQFAALAGDCEVLAVEAHEEGIEGLSRSAAALEATCRERVTVADEWVAWQPGPPDEIPTAPDVDVEYEALTDEQPLGVGGNADVTRATLPSPEGDVTLAIKKPRMSGTLHTEQVERMLKEAETWDKLDDHDHVVDSVDYGSTPLPWIAMEYMDGGHLGERAGLLETGEALWTAIAITNAVHHAHRRGIAHLDLKPENVLFRTVEGAWDVPKVADWGLSKHLLDHSKSVQGMTVEYAAPEQFGSGFGSTDDITDVYQLGAVLYELFIGRPPFEGKPFDVINQVKNDRPTPPSEIADVPEALDDVLLTALAREKADRYESVVYLRDDLREIYHDRRPPEL